MTSTYFWRKCNATHSTIHRVMIPMFISLVLIPSNFSLPCLAFLLGCPNKYLNMDKTYQLFQPTPQTFPFSAFFISVNGGDIYFIVQLKNLKIIFCSFLALSSYIYPTCNPSFFLILTSPGLEMNHPFSLSILQPQRSMPP